MAERSKREKRIVIIGGGAIGCASAYYITRHPQYDPTKYRITLLEATRIAGGSSGKANGAIASWAAPPCLAALSWKLHTELAEEYDGASRYGYRRVRSLYCDINLTDAPGLDPPVDPTKSTQPQDPTAEAVPEWVYSGRLTTCALRGNGPEGSAQLHPFLFTTTLAEEAKSRGTDIIFGSAVSIGYSTDGGSVSSVSYKLKDSPEIHELLADVIVVAAGPWSANVLPKLPIGGERNNSLLLKVPSEELVPDLVSFSNAVPDSWFPRVKLYPRPDDTVHVAAGTDHLVPLPPSTDLVKPDKTICLRIRQAAEYVSPHLQGREVLIEQACYRPVVTIPGRDRNKGPLLGSTAISGLLIATGHDNWGIQNSASTGKIVSELILDGKVTSADISSLAPGDVV